MRMDNQDESGNVQDVRGSGFRPIHGVGLGTVVLAVIGGWVFGVNPLDLLGLLGGTSSSLSTAPTQGAATAPPADDAQAKFVSQVLRSTEVVWGHLFAQMGRSYSEPSSMRTLWPLAPAPPALRRPGTVRARLRRRARGGAPRQADCLAGVWANRSQQEQGWRLEPGDVESALNAASQIGDDTLQRRSQGTVVPESFTHGTSAQRVSWFKRGLAGGTIDACDTANADRL